MFLKRLELQGFKSFADKTVLTFGQGATGVVGPNGSGKSNISDAIRWVVGEMSAKSLRGSNMQDVIFAGTEKRKQVNYAEVSLVLDNSEHVFNLDYEEVIVTRRLFRSGESVYQINKSNCRLKDIHELFMDTGLGRDGYSIIGQGNVSQILSTKAEDRRSLFEEAAGVSKYKYRKEEAARKLTSVEENLIRIGDITAELEGQIEPLRKQSEKARKYLVLYEEYKGLDINLSVSALDKNARTNEETDKLYKETERELEEIRTQESELEEKLSSLYDQSKKKDIEHKEKNDLLLENESKGMANSNEISINENNIKNNNYLLKRIDEETDGIKKRNEERRSQIESLEKEIVSKEEEAKLILDEFDLMKSENLDIDKKQAQFHDEIESLKGEVIENMNSAAAKRERIGGIDQLRNSFLERKSVVEAEIKSFAEGIENTKREIEESERTAGIKKEKLSKLKEGVDGRRKNAEKLQNDLNENNKKYNAMRVDYDSKSSKKKILEGMENDYAGYARSVKAVLKAPELKKPSFHGTISGLIDVDKEHVIAVEQALGGALQNIIVDTEEDAKEAINYLRRTNNGRATFLPISSVKGRMLDNADSVSKSHGFVGVASRLVRYNPKYDGIIQSLLGRVVIFDTMDNAIAVSRKFGYKFRVVTLEGDILSSGGSMSGGSVNKSSGFLSRATEIKALSKELNTLGANITKLSEKMKSDRALWEEENNRINTYMPMIREYEDEILSLENNIVYLKKSIESGGSTEDSYRTELKQIEEQLGKSSEETASILNEIRSIESRNEELQERINSLTLNYNEITAKKDEQSQSMMDKTVKLGSMEKDVQMARRSIESLQNELKRAEEEILHKNNDKERIHVENEKLYCIIKEKNKLNDEIRRISQQLKESIKEIDNQKSMIVDNLQKIQSSNKDITDKIINLQNELTRLENRLEKLAGEKENILNRLWDEYELTYNTASQMRTETENEKEDAKRLSELKGKIRALGSVNMDSIEEYKNVKERFEFLTAQKSDLEKSKENLNKIIGSMEELMEEHFGEQFSIINESFSKVFTELFGGGKGRLYLSDPNNILESGIEIEVQLPGKGLQNINLYSGGEKSFIAIALLFAILQVKPTPFCILDEIDAALDDVNVSRFATYLKNYVDQTQFIVITHRRGTMEAANILYGVTMQEKGVSKLLSLQIDDVEDGMVE